MDGPDEIRPLEVGRASLPLAQYRDIGFESRQVFDIDILRIVTEYRAQIVEDEKGNHYTAPFPSQVTKAAQYGNGVKLETLLPPHRMPAPALQRTPSA